MKIYFRRYLRVTNILKKLKLNNSIKRQFNGRNNKVVVSKSVGFDKCKVEIAGNGNRIQISSGCYFNQTTFYIKGNNNIIQIDDNVKFFDKGSFLWIEDDFCEIKIGAFSTFVNTHIAATEPKSKITIGRDCMFANDIDIRTGDSHSIIDIESKKRINYAKDVNIGDHVWVASHVSILKGVSLRNNVVVATRSVVTKAFCESNILVGGSPAKILKSGVTWDRARLYDENI